MDYVPAGSGSTRTEGLIVVFDGGVLTDDDRLRLPPDELVAWAFVAPPDLGSYLPPVGRREHRRRRGARRGARRAPDASRSGQRSPDFTPSRMVAMLPWSMTTGPVGTDCWAPMTVLFFLYSHSESIDR
jgi:hypothetical protein